MHKDVIPLIEYYAKNMPSAIHMANLPILEGMENLGRRFAVRIIGKWAKHKGYIFVPHLGATDREWKLFVSELRKLVWDYDVLATTARLSRYC